jgi:hypothetical protein
MKRRTRRRIPSRTRRPAQCSRTRARSLVLDPLQRCLRAWPSRVPWALSLRSPTVAGQPRIGPRLISFLDERVPRRDPPLHPTRAVRDQSRLSRAEPAELDPIRAFLLPMPRVNANPLARAPAWANNLEGPHMHRLTVPERLAVAPEAGTTGCPKTGPQRRAHASPSPIAGAARHELCRPTARVEGVADPAGAGPREAGADLAVATEGAPHHVAAGAAPRHARISPSP